MPLAGPSPRRSSGVRWDSAGVALVLAAIGAVCLVTGNVMDAGPAKRPLQEVGSLVFIIGIGLPWVARLPWVVTLRTGGQLRWRSDTPVRTKFADCLFVTGGGLVLVGYASGTLAVFAAGVAGVALSAALDARERSESLMPRWPAPGS